MIPSRARITFLFRRWYWNQPYTTRKVLSAAPHWLAAIAFGLIIGIIAGAGF